MSAADLAGLLHRSSAYHAPDRAAAQLLSHQHVILSFPEITTETDLAPAIVQVNEFNGATAAWTLWEYAYELTAKPRFARLSSGEQALFLITCAIAKADQLYWGLRDSGNIDFDPELSPEPLPPLVDLLTGLDQGNVRLVMDAVAVAAGQPDMASGAL